MGKYRIFGQMRVHLGMDVLGDPPLPHHPEDHRREQGDADEHRDALEQLFCPALEAASEDVEEDCSQHAQAKAESDAHPDRLLVRFLVRALKIGQDDADDEGGLQSLSECD